MLRKVVTLINMFIIPVLKALQFYVHNYKLVKIIFVEVILACVPRDCIVKPKQL